MESIFVNIAVTSLVNFLAVHAEKVLKWFCKKDVPRISAIIDGYFYPQISLKINGTGGQSHVSTLGVRNSDELNYGRVLRNCEPKLNNYLRTSQILCSY